MDVVDNSPIGSVKAHTESTYARERWKKVVDFFAESDMEVVEVFSNYDQYETLTLRRPDGELLKIKINGGKPDGGYMTVEPTP